MFVANSMPILLKHLMLRSLVLRVVRSLVLGPRSLPPRTLSTAQEGRELPLPSIPVGGRLSQFSTQWEKRTSDPWVLSIIRGGGIRTSVQTVAISVGVSHSLYSLFGSSQTSTSVRGSVCSVAEGSNRTGSNFLPGSTILFPSLLGPQEKGGNETSNRPFYFEYLPCGPPFQNGDQQVHQGFYTPRNVVDIARFNRCLFPLPYFCGFQEIPSLRVGQQSFFSFELSHSG